MDNESPHKPARVVLITGASSGIGRACAEHLHHQGYRVFGTSRKPVPTPREGRSIEWLQMDVTSDDSVKQALDRLMGVEDRVDVVVNSAGFGYAGAVEDTSVDEAKSQFETNFFGVLRVCRGILPIMRQQRSGTIVNVGSLAGRAAVPFQGLYSASKFALEGMTESLRMEVQPFGIRVVLIEPGDFRTTFTSNRLKTSQSKGTTVYAEEMARCLAVAERDERNGCAPERVAQLLDELLSESSPRLRYTTGPISERFAVSLKNALPQRLFERLLLGHYGLKPR